MRIATQLFHRNSYRFRQPLISSLLFNFFATPVWPKILMSMSLDEFMTPRSLVTEVLGAEN